MKKKCKVCKNVLNGNQRSFCSNNCKQKNHWHTVKNQQNSYHSQTIRAFKRKLFFIDQLGGKCSKCGYRNNISVLQFHHKDPSVKSFSLDQRNLSNRTINILQKEVNKCILLCANCHNEHHYPECDRKRVEYILKQHLENKKQL